MGEIVNESMSNQLLAGDHGAQVLLTGTQIRGSETRHTYTQP